MAARQGVGSPLQQLRRKADEIDQLRNSSPPGGAIEAAAQAQRLLDQACHGVARIEGPERIELLCPRAAMLSVQLPVGLGDRVESEQPVDVAPRQLPEARVGDIMVFHDTGAYGASMAGNYDSRPLAAEVLIDGDDVRLIRRRQTIEDLLALERV